MIMIVSDAKIAEDRLKIIPSNRSLESLVFSYGRATRTTPDKAIIQITKSND